MIILLIRARGQTGVVSDHLCVPSNAIRGFRAESRGSEDQQEAKKARGRRDMILPKYLNSHKPTVPQLLGFGGRNYRLREHVEVPAVVQKRYWGGSGTFGQRTPAVPGSPHQSPAMPSLALTVLGYCISTYCTVQ